MKGLFLVSSIFLHFNVIYGATLIDSGIRRTNSLEELLSEDSSECSSLVSSDLIDEIQSYQPIVNQIVAAAIKSEFTGSTWERLVYLLF